MGEPFRVLVTGASGLLGYDVCLELERRGIEYLGTASADMDITDREAVWRVVTGYHPDAVIHCAAYTAVERAEDESEKAFAVNGQGTRNIAEVCKEIGAKLLYISTDYVFSGAGTRPYEVDDLTGPLNMYGKSKLAGERAVKETLEKYFIVRISWVFGSHGNNFVKTMLRLGETYSSIQIVNDQIGSPTYTVDLAPLLCDMVQTEKYGIYHATNEGECSWAEFARAIFQTAGYETTVEEISTAEYTATNVVRPLNSRLSKLCLVKRSFFKLPSYQSALQRFLQESCKICQERSRPNSIKR